MTTSTTDDMKIEHLAEVLKNLSGCFETQSKHIFFPLGRRKFSPEIRKLCLEKFSKY